MSSMLRAIVAEYDATENALRLAEPLAGVSPVLALVLARISHTLTEIVGTLYPVESPSPPRFLAGEKVPTGG